MRWLSILLAILLLVGCAKGGMRYTPMAVQPNNKMQEAVFAAVSNPNVQKYLNMLSQSEGTASLGNQSGYNIGFGGTIINDYTQHPGVSKGFTNKKGQRQTTTAAGRYQFLKGTWDGKAKQLGLKDFSPMSQDLAAVGLMYETGSLGDVLKGDMTAAVKKDGRIWASLPTSPYPQGKHSWQQVNSWLSSEGLPAATPAGDMGNVSDYLPASISQNATTPVQDSPSVSGFDFNKNAEIQELALQPNQLASQEILPYRDINTGQIQGAVPETPQEYAQLQAFNTFDMGTRGALLNLESQLNQAELIMKRQAELFDPYPTYFDERLRRLIAEA